jgi:hypothetical protein
MRPLYFIIAIGLLVGCRHGNDYKIVSFAEDPSVSSGIDPILGHKFILLHEGVRIVAHCWIPQHAIADTSCLTLKSKVGETVQLERWEHMSDALIYHPNAPNTEAEEVLRVASATVERNRGPDNP